MSLSHIRALRKRGAKPAMVAVILGDLPAWMEDGPTIVHIPERARISPSEWTCLIGVWVTVYWLSGPKSRAHAVADALEAAGAKLFGAYIDGVAYSLTRDRSVEEVHAIREYGEALRA